MMPKIERDVEQTSEERPTISRELSYSTASAREAINEERGAPSTIEKRKRIQGVWFSFLEENGLQREWDPRGPPIGTYTNNECCLGPRKKLILFLHFRIVCWVHATNCRYGGWYDRQDHNDGDVWLDHNNLF